MVNRVLSDRYLLDRLVYGFITLVMIIRWGQEVMLHQFHQPEVLSPIINNTYWLFLFTGIPQFIAGHEGAAMAVDIALVIVPLSLMLAPRIMGLRVLLFLLLLVYVVTFHCIMAKQGHGLYGLLIMSFVLIFRYNKGHFNLMRSAARYYACFIFVSAALWKLTRGHVFSPDHFSNILAYQHASLLFYQPGYWLNDLYWYLMEHSLLAQGVLFAGILLQLSFAVGFFTRKYDGVLFVLFILFLVMNFVVMNLAFLSLSVLLVLFVRRDWVTGFFPKLYGYRTVHE